MIHFLPYWKFTIDSDKTPEEVCHIMEAETKQFGVIFGPLFDSDFIGEVEETSFEVVLPVGIFDSFEPVILGQIQPQGSGTRVDIRMRLRWSAFAASAVCFGMMGLYFVLCVLSLITGNPIDSDIWKETITAAGGILFLQLIVRVGFYIPARKAKRKLEGLFGTAEV